MSLRDFALINQESEKKKVGVIGNVIYNGSLSTEFGFFV